MNKIKVQMESRSAKDCFRIATTSLALAKRADEEWEIEHHVITGITFSAFSIEAMINHYARIYNKDWNNLKGSRKEAHKKFFKDVNLPNYLGTKEYQNANACFELRDMFAHGKTKNEILTIDFPEDSDSETVFNHMVQLGSEPFRKSDLKLLQLFVDTAKKIEKDIESNGFYPNQDHIELTLRSKLRECPLSVSGVRSW
ncbi:hypothetical protein [Aliivibrio sifiae]|uniref:HEPN domain-containing protein n=1 Tax=Aliivibrio sifiae TaxID=566293 RepID=A0A2S7X7Y6_9GAMM|nr:hypothetical protein [Aliivibrio sifiae]PQJ87459.1 hypothetical protein BTO23_15215 [Aliivibrio sifiae]GLR77172.1 hypothetical protein GCM10007855_40470 [Aliivibrio sifiae]